MIQFGQLHLLAKSKNLAHVTEQWNISNGSQPLSLKRQSKVGNHRCTELHTFMEAIPDSQKGASGEGRRVEAPQSRDDDGRGNRRVVSDLWTRIHSLKSPMSIKQLIHRMIQPTIYASTQGPKFNYPSSSSSPFLSNRYPGPAMPYYSIPQSHDTCIPGGGYERLRST